MPNVSQELMELSDEISTLPIGEPGIDQQEDFIVAYRDLKQRIAAIR